MDHYNATGVTKSGEIKISRPVGAILVKASQGFAAFTTEKIKVYIEKASGNNVIIANNIPLGEFLALSAHGLSMIVEKAGSTSAMCVIANGAIELGENEHIKIELEGLKALVTYQVNSVEFPVFAQRTFKFDRKTLNTDETARKFEVTGYDLLHISGVDAVEQMDITYENGRINKLLNAEILALAEFEDPAFLVKDGLIDQHPVSSVVFPLDMVRSLDIQKSNAKAVNLTLLSK